jgi:DNA-directed RNA polymerase specialized sigma24 family protein
LARFLDGREEAFFAAIVGRHGPLVLGVCRRVLRQEQDAEDAVQVVCLVLACKAASVRPREALANWLYRATCKATLKARSTAAGPFHAHRASANHRRPRLPLLAVLVLQVAELQILLRAVAHLVFLEHGEPDTRS